MYGHVLSAFPVLFHLILPTTLGGRYLSLPHFTDAETEFERFTYMVGLGLDLGPFDSADNALKQNLLLAASAH